MPTTTKTPSDASATCASLASLTETSMHRCPHCSSCTVMMAPGHVLVDAAGMIRIEYRCCDCEMPFWLLQPLALGERLDDEAILREQAQAAIRRGRLPACRRPDRAWAGPGVDAACAVCERPIHRYDMEFAIQFEHRGAPGALDAFHLHLRCFAAWELERHAA